MPYAGMWRFCALSSTFSSVLARCTKCTRQPPYYLKRCQIFTDLKKITGRLSNKPFLIRLLTTPPHLNVHGLDLSLEIQVSSSGVVSNLKAMGPFPIVLVVPQLCPHKFLMRWHN